MLRVLAAELLQNYCLELDTTIAALRKHDWRNKIRHHLTTSTSLVFRPTKLRQLSLFSVVKNLIAMLFHKRCHFSLANDGELPLPYVYLITFGDLSNIHPLSCQNG